MNSQIEIIQKQFYLPHNDSILLSNGFFISAVGDDYFYLPLLIFSITANMFQEHVMPQCVDSSYWNALWTRCSPKNKEPQPKAVIHYLLWRPLSAGTLSGLCASVAASCRSSYLVSFTHSTSKEWRMCTWDPRCLGMCGVLKDVTALPSYGNALLSITFYQCCGLWCAQTQPL